MLPSGTKITPESLKGYKTEDGLCIFPNVYDGEYDYFSPAVEITQRTVDDVAKKKKEINTVLTKMKEKI